MTSRDASAAPDFDDLAAYTALPRLTGLTLGPDGSRLVATTQAPDDDGARYVSSLWQIPTGDGSPVRLTRSAKGESSPAFAPDGALLFVSSRPDPGSDGDEDDPVLWSLPPRGEPVVLARRAGGLGGPVVARDSGTVVVAGSRLTHTADDADDAERRATRRDRKVSAILHTGMPVRYWDHELGIESPRLFVRDADGGLRDLAPDARTELQGASYSISADGTTLVTSWSTRERGGRTSGDIAIIEVATGKRAVVAAGDDAYFSSPVICPDGGRVAAAYGTDGAFDRPITSVFTLIDVDGGDRRTVELGDLSATEWSWSADSRTVYVSGDLHGRGAVLAIDADAGTVICRLACDAVYSSLCATPDGSGLFALRSAIDAPNTPVRLDVAEVDQQPEFLTSPAPAPPLPGTASELWVAAADGARVHAWLCLPEPGTTPAPVMLWIHGGPFGSYNSWSWRWNPWVAVARGWAVVMPDPAHSTGYGQGWIDRAWPYVAADVYADCEAVLDEVLARPDVDATKVACLGASFGGYMTNWVAAHVDRFAAIVTHSGSYALDQQHTTTDAAHYKSSLFGTPREHPDWYERNSPHNAPVGATPMLVIHGKRDFRVPHGETLRLFWDLVSSWPGEPESMPHRFLEFTAQNHWITAPADAEVWYDAVLGFCAQHVLGEQWTPTALL